MIMIKRQLVGCRNISMKSLQGAVQRTLPEDQSICKDKDSYITGSDCVFLAVIGQRMSRGECCGTVYW